MGLPQNNHIGAIRFQMVIPMIQHKAKTNIRFFILCSLITLSIFSTINLIPSVSAIEVASGDTFVWEKQDGRKVLGFVKYEYLNITNGTVYGNYESYDLVGDLEITLENKSAGFYWTDPAIYPEWLNFNYEMANITHLDQEFECIIRVREYGTEITTEYYDYESGILVKSESNEGETIELISLEDLDVQEYVASLGSFLPFGTPLVIIGISSLVILPLLTKTRKKVKER